MLKDILKDLVDKQAELEKRISAIEADFRKGRSQDFSEQTVENENNEVLNEIHHEAKVELALVNQAIEKIEKDEYGFCDSCGESINPERLKILPYIDTCINCAE